MEGRFPYPVCTMPALALLTRPSPAPSQASCAPPNSRSVPQPASRVPSPSPAIPPPHTSPALFLLPHGAAPQPPARDACPLLPGRWERPREQWWWCVLLGPRRFELLERPLRHRSGCVLFRDGLRGRVCDSTRRRRGGLFFKSKYSEGVVGEFKEAYRIKRGTRGRSCLGRRESAV